MAKSRTKADSSRGQAAAKASAATKKTASSKSSKESQTPAQPKAKSAAAVPVSSDIRQAYKKSLLGKYLDTHRGQPAIKPKK